MPPRLVAPYQPSLFDVVNDIPWDGLWWADGPIGSTSTGGVMKSETGSTYDLQVEQGGGLALSTSSSLNGRGVWVRGAFDSCAATNMNIASDIDVNGASVFAVVNWVDVTFDYSSDSRFRLFGWVDPGCMVAVSSQNPPTTSYQGDMWFYRGDPTSVCRQAWAQNTPTNTREIWELYNQSGVANTVVVNGISIQSGGGSSDTNTQMDEFQVGSGIGTGGPNYQVALLGTMYGRLDAEPNHGKLMDWCRWYYGQPFDQAPGGT